MKEQLISFETAKLAKEKNYPFYFTAIGDTKEVPLNIPTQSLLQKWLREKHDIHININTYYFEDLQKYGYEVEDIIHPEGWIVLNNPKKTYEEALEKGLQEALKLIEL